MIHIYIYIYVVYVQLGICLFAHMKFYIAPPLAAFGALKGPSAPLQVKAGSSICQQEKHRIRCHQTWEIAPFFVG